MDDRFSPVLGQRRGAQRPDTAPITAGARVAFRYDPADWHWLKDTFGPLGPYLPPEGPREADYAVGTVLELCERLPMHAPAADYALIRLDRPLGWSAVEEYDDDELLAQGWARREWPTDFEAPLHALSALGSAAEPFRLR